MIACVSNCRLMPPGFTVSNSPYRDADSMATGAIVTHDATGLWMHVTDEISPQQDVTRLLEAADVYGGFLSLSACTSRSAPAYDLHRECAKRFKDTPLPYGGWPGISPQGKT